MKASLAVAAAPQRQPGSAPALGCGAQTAVWTGATASEHSRAADRTLWRAGESADLRLAARPRPSLAPARLDSAGGRGLSAP